MFVTKLSSGQKHSVMFCIKSNICMPICVPIWPCTAADWTNHLPWMMMGTCTAFLKDRDFSLAESVFSSQLVLPGQFVDTAESTLPSILEELQNTMAGPSLPQARHHILTTPTT
jgi:hypothetical protein